MCRIKIPDFPELSFDCVRLTLQVVQKPASATPEKIETKHQFVSKIRVALGPRLFANCSLGKYHEPLDFGVPTLTTKPHVDLWLG